MLWLIALVHGYLMHVNFMEDEAECSRKLYGKVIDLMVERRQADSPGEPGEKIHHLKA